MDTRTYNINLRNDYFNPVAVGLSQYDEGVTLAFNVYDGTDPAEFAAGTTAQIQGVRPSGVGFNMACTLAGNVATVNTSTDMTGEAGIFPVEIRFYNSGVNVGTCNFIFAIEKAAHPDGTIDADITHEQDIVDKINQILVQTTPDPTLSESGVAADAAATGQAIEIANESIRILGASLNTAINNVDSDVRKKAPVIWKEASGNPVIVEDGAGYVKDRAAQMYAFNVAVDFEPVQDFNGYDYAWAGGNGKNKLNNTLSSRTTNGVTFTVNADGTVTANGTAGSGGAQVRITFDGLSGNFKYCGCPSGGGSQSYYVFAWDITANEYFNKWDGTTRVSFDYGDMSLQEVQIPSGHSGAISLRVVGGYTANNLVFKPMIVNADVADNTFAPYENICPISGAESVTVKRTGKNLFDLSTLARGGITYSDGVLTGTAASFYINFNANAGGIGFNFVAGKQYAMSFEAYTDGNAGTSGAGLVVSILHKDGTETRTVISNNVSGFSEFVVTSVAGKDVKAIYFIYMSLGANVWHIRNLQIEFGDTATDYEPYNSQTVSINLGGEYYGGTIDIATGQLDVTWQSFTFDGSSDEDWAAYAETGRTWPTLWSIPSVSGIDYTAKPYCETWRTKISTPTKDELGTIGIAQQPPAGFIDVRPPVDYATKAEWRAYLAANPITIWVKMKEPITVGTLDWYDLEMLYKYNVLTTDGTNIRLVYPVDTKIYIDNAIAVISG